MNAWYECSLSRTLPLTTHSSRSSEEAHYPGLIRPTVRLVQRDVVFVLMITAFFRNRFSSILDRMETNLRRLFRLDLWAFR